MAVARACNEFDATLIRDHPARFGGLAMLPLPHIDGSLEEVAYALDELRLDGVGLYSSTDGIYLGHAHYDPLLEELNRRQTVVFVHPTHCAAPEELNLRAPAGILEYVVDTSRAILKLMSALPLPEPELLMSEAEYLAFQEGADTKHGFVDGMVHDWPGYEYGPA